MLERPSASEGGRKRTGQNTVRGVGWVVLVGEGGLCRAPESVVRDYGRPWPGRAFLCLSVCLFAFSPNNSRSTRRYTPCQNLCLRALDHAARAGRSAYCSMPYTSKHGDAFVPNVTLTDYVLARADAAPAGATAFTDGPSGRAVAYSSLRAHVSSVAAGLWQRGLRKGDVLALFMPNHPECGSMDKVLSRQRASSGRPWRLLAARHSQGEA